MSSRRAPLISNPNAANSPLRGAALALGNAKQKRSYATIQREEPYGQPPPVKKQALDNGTQRAVRSPSKLNRPQALAPRGTTRLPIKDRSLKTVSAPKTAQDVDVDKEVWKKHHRAKFPKMVFYFESIPDDVRAKLKKRVTYLGARQEPFFSIDVTHVVTTRSIPPERPESRDADVLEDGQREPEQQLQTINPSLLDRSAANPTQRKLFEFRSHAAPSLRLDDPTKWNKGSRNNDVLYKAREMGKKIWSLDKFQTMLSVLLEGEMASNNYLARTTSTRSHYGASKAAQEPNLLQLLHNERINGPSDRDPTAVNRELSYFKGPYIYIWDMDEKQKPIMVREYPKVVNKADGEWPQFRSVGNGRCPFVEEVDLPPKREQEKARTAKRGDFVPVLKAPAIPAPRPLTGKRTLAEMEDGNNKGRGVTPTEVFNPAKAALTKQTQPRTQNAFTSRAEGGRTLGGEPVASGMQPSNVTSAIRSQMISSTSGINGVKAGTSKEIHGLQRKVLQKAAPVSQDTSSRRVGDMSVDVASSRSASLSRNPSKTAQVQEEDSQKATGANNKKPQSQALKSKKDLKPGYCENCQDKFRDFDEHILSRKHRKFAENDVNWTDLDSLLGDLKRKPRYSHMVFESEGW